MDLRAARAPSNNARHVSASKKHYTAWIEGKHRISIATYRLLDAKRACCAEDTCNQPRSEQTSAVSIYALSTRISSFFFLFQYKIRAIFSYAPVPWKCERVLSSREKGNRFSRRERIGFQDTDAFEIRSFVREDNILFRSEIISPFEARKSLLNVCPVEAFIVNRVTFRRGLTTWLSNCIVPRFIRSTNLVARD